MIIGAHSIIYSKSPDADRAFLRDVLELSGVRRLPAAAHPAEDRKAGERAGGRREETRDSEEAEPPKEKGLAWPRDRRAEPQ